MIGAFVLIVAAAVVAGVLIGGTFTMVTLIPLGIVLGAAGRVHHLRPARAEVGVPQGRRPDRCRGVGAGQPARQVAGHPRRRRHRPLRRRAPGDRPARRDLRRRRFAARVKPLLAQEKKRTARLVGDTPIYDIVVGNDEGQVPLSKLERHLTKLPANITAKQMDALESRLAALGTRSGPAAMPKGPMPGARRCGACSAPCVAQVALRQRAHDGGAGQPVLQTAAVGVGEQRGMTTARSAVRARSARTKPTCIRWSTRHLQSQRELPRREAEQPHRRRRRARTRRPAPWSTSVPRRSTDEAERHGQARPLRRR